MAPTKLQIGYYLFAGLCTLVSLLIQWRRTGDDSEHPSTASYESAERARTRLRSEIVELLYNDLLPARQLLLHLSTERRLRNELELIVGKPKTMRILADLLKDILYAENYPLRLRRIRRIQTTTVVISVLLMLGLSLPLIGWLMGESMRFDLGSWTILVALVLAVTTFVIATTMKSRYENRMNEILYSNPRSHS